MSLEIRAGEGWRYLDFPSVDFKPADGLQIPPNGHKRGLHGPNDLYVLIEHELGAVGGYFTEVVFVNLPDCDSLRGRGRIKAFDPHYPLNSLVVQLKHPGECLEWGQQNTPDYLRIDHSWEAFLPSPIGTTIKQ